jgi:hypothetical protein
MLCVRLVTEISQGSCNSVRYINGLEFEKLRNTSKFNKTDYSKHVIHLNFSMLLEKFWVADILSWESHCIIKETQFWTKLSYSVLVVSY